MVVTFLPPVARSVPDGFIWIACIPLPQTSGGYSPLKIEIRRGKQAHLSVSSIKGISRTVWSLVFTRLRWLHFAPMSTSSFETHRAENILSWSLISILFFSQRYGRREGSLWTSFGQNFILFPCSREAKYSKHCALRYWVKVTYCKLKNALPY